MRNEFDVIIVGASFGGLATASRLRGDVLLIDRDPIGSHRRSACGTFLSVPTALDLLDSVLQISDRGVIHAPGVPAYGFEDPLCTLDYERFCEGLFEQGRATFVQASVRGRSSDGSGSEVVTDHGRFRARHVVDASGWRAALASTSNPGLSDRSALSYGLETDAPYNSDTFYFWLDRELIRDGVGWIFPAGAQSRVGLASYRGETVKAERVREFLRPTGADATSFHGGFFPNRLRPATAGSIFLVGDSAGQCLPLTGEGIRPAIYFGQRCGDLIQQAIEGEITAAEALAAYRRLVAGVRWEYQLLRLAQQWLPGLPGPLMRGLLRFVEAPVAHHWLLRRYLRLMPLEPPLRSLEAVGTRADSQHSSSSQFRFSRGHSR